MNTQRTRHSPLIDDRVAEYKQRLIEHGARPEPRLHLVERWWPWMFVIAMVAVAGIMQHWS